MHPARSTSPVRLLAGALAAIAGIVSLAALPYPLRLMTDAVLDNIDWTGTIDEPVNGPLLILTAVTTGWALWGGCCTRPLPTPSQRCAATPGCGSRCRCTRR
ncbi:hypothetical protein ACQEVZ_58795 [Dactylosporangium sp. CA-152071]|uniref:hypothetical protein n=1 Tax=Dactylosporangium sp. CA-152071 TaxID=3239933 RepID=UPI003D921D8F